MHSQLPRANSPATARLNGLFLLMVLLAPFCQAQISAAPKTAPGSFSLDTDRLQIATLDGQWRFHAGDDPRWANPNFNDSSWPLVRSDKSWPEQNLPVASGSYWYRVRVFVPAGAASLSLYCPALHFSYQVFADGRLLGGVGAMPPHPHPTGVVARVFAVSTATSPQAHTVVIAIRGWRWPVWDQVYTYGLEPGIRIGQAQLIQQTALLNTRELSWNSVSTIFGTLLEFLAGLAAIAVFRVRRYEKEYFWFSVAMLISGINDSVSTYRVFHSTDVAQFVVLGNCLSFASYFALIAFYRHLFSSKRDWLYWSAIACMTAGLLLNSVVVAPLIVSSNWPVLNLSLWTASSMLLMVPFVAWVLILLFRKTRQGRIDALLLLVSNLLGNSSMFVTFMVYTAKPVFGWNIGPMDWYYRTAQWPFPFSITDISGALLIFTMLAVLIQRFTRTSLQEEDHKRELEAARVVQQVLIPDEIPPIPGFSIATVYKPAGQVGGDFFQIIPIATGGALVVIGDVSGKGMPAAMTVSLLVGTVRTLAHYTQSPGEILASMNQRMLARSGGGFTTCLILRLDIDGTLTLANAGHLAPYCNGKELPLENGLPLGLAAGTVYTESSFRFGLNTQLTLVTDGVVEARGNNGELYGFDRAAMISVQSADFIARTAQDWGQDDDITVLTLTRMAPGEQSATVHTASAFAPS